MKKTVEKTNQIRQENNTDQQFVVSLGNSVEFEKTKNKSRIIKQGISIARAMGIAVIVASCSSPAQNAENNVTEARENQSRDQQEENRNRTQQEQDRNRIQQEYADDVSQFRLETDRKILANEKEISDINEKIKKNKSDQRAEYEKQVAVLEQKNKDQKKKLNDYKTDSNEDWESFKIEFNKDMDELGLALKNFAIQNK
ncbi:MAG: hypothetical protein ACK4K0_00310 [Flavobacteriales bacterium]